MSLAATLSLRLFVLIIGRASMLALGLVVTALLTRHLGPFGFGQYRTAVAYLGLVVVLADLGLTSIFIRDISRPGVDQPKIVGNALCLRLVLATSIFVTASLISLLFDFDRVVHLGIFGGVVGFIAYSTHLMMFGVFHQKLKQHWAIIAEILGGIVLVSAVVFLMSSEAALPWFVVALASSYLLTALISLAMAYRLVPFRLRFDLEQVRKLVFAALPLAGGATLSIIYLRADSVLLALLQGPDSVGIYGVPIKIFDSVMGIILLATGLFAPFFANTAQSKPSEFSRFVDDGLLVVTVGSVAIGLVLCALADQVILILAGEAFYAAITPLRLLTIVMVLHAMIMLLKEVVTAMGLQRRLLPVYGTGFVAAFIAYFLLIPPLATVGAVLSLIVAEFAVLAGIIWIIKRQSKRLISPYAPVMAISCGLVVAAAIMIIDQFTENWIAMTIVAVLGYVSALLVTKTIEISKLIDLGKQIIASRVKS